MSCCGCISRLLALVLLLCFTACIVLSNFFPLFRSTTTNAAGATQKLSVFYWYHETTVKGGADAVDTKSRVYSRNLQCDVERKMFIAACSLSAAASALGALAAIFSIFWMLPCCRCAMGAIVFLFTLLAGFCCAGVFGMMTWGFFRGFCQLTPATAVPALANSGYNMVEGYVLLCAAGLGFFLMALLEAIGFCCARCCAACASASRKRRAENPTEPTHVDGAKEAPHGTRSTSENTPYAHNKE